MTKSIPCSWGACGAIRVFHHGVSPKVLGSLTGTLSPIQNRPYPEQTQKIFLIHSSLTINRRVPACQISVDKKTADTRGETWNFSSYPGRFYIIVQEKHHSGLPSDIGSGMFHFADWGKLFHKKISSNSNWTIFKCFQSRTNVGKQCIEQCAPSFRFP